jgi:asparagine synthase (glutamine-hydrolysing)
MCGIWALIKEDVELNTTNLKSIQRLKNRGPDSTIIHKSRSFIFAFHRLAINDLSSAGNQPFVLSTKTADYMMMINGEIYNHKIIENQYGIIPKSNSDCEFILELFVKLNEDFNYINKIINGEYAICILKLTKNKTDFEHIEIFISVDPLSVRPLFYYVDPVKNEIGISSILAGLSDLSTDVKRVNQGTIIHFITNFETISHQSYSYINNSIGQLTLSNNNLSDVHQLIVDILFEAIKTRLISDRPIGCLLSGGLDSSLVAGIASNILKSQGHVLKTFSIGMQGGTDNIYAKKVAEHIGSDHTEFIFDEEEGLSVIDKVIEATETFDITTIRASVGQYILADRISKTTDVKVILNGDGADECQMGYLYFYMWPDLESATLDRDKLLDNIHLYDGLRVDRNLAYHGLEARVPFLDWNFVNLYKHIDSDLLVPTQDNMEKYLIRSAFENIMPDLLPKEVLWRKKEAFSDGVSSHEKSWFEILKSNYENNISELEFETYIGSLDKSSQIVPPTKEAYYYMKKFDVLFGQNISVIPKYWLQSWTNTSEPSARTLSVYNK